MTARDFCYWLQGFFELRRAGVTAQLVGTPLPLGPITAAQAEAVERHLALVFAHEIDPAAGPQAVQQQLDHIHHGPEGSRPRC